MARYSLDPPETERRHKEIKQLQREADAAHRSAQYALAELLYGQAAELAGDDVEWPLRISLHYWLAQCRQMQNRYEEAMVTYVWLIGLASDPQVAAELRGTREVTYLYHAFVDLAALGRHLPHLSIRRLHNLLDEAGRFLADLGHPEWAHSLRLERAELFEAEERWAEARQELEAALALRRRDPDSMGYTLGSHLFQLAAVLLIQEDYAGAIRCYQEIWRDSTAGAWNRRTAAVGMARLMLRKRDLTAAEQWAREALALAAEIESPQPQFDTHHELLRIMIARDRPAEARAEGAQLWRWGRKFGVPAAEYRTAWELSRLHLGCARRHAGQPLDPEKPLPERLPHRPFQALRLAYHELDLAERWFGRARPLARRLDKSTGLTAHHDELKWLAAKLREFRAWLERE